MSACMEMPEQDEFITETEIARMHQTMMDAQSTPTSLDDIPSKHTSRQARLERKKINDAIRHWDEREIKRVFYHPKDDPNRRHRKVDEMKAKEEYQNVPQEREFWSCKTTCCIVMDVWY